MPLRHGASFEDSLGACELFSTRLIWLAFDNNPNADTNHRGGVQRRRLTSLAHTLVIQTAGRKLTQAFRSSQALACGATAGAKAPDESNRSGPCPPVQCDPARRRSIGGHDRFGKIWGILSLSTLGPLLSTRPTAKRGSIDLIVQTNHKYARHNVNQRHTFPTLS